MESILKNLEIEKYDTLSDDEKKQLKIIAENNLPLKTLLYNYENKNPLKIEYIIGPESITLLTKGNKNVLLIGEVHTEYDVKVDKGIRIDAFLLHLFKYSFVPLDFYLETGTKSYKGQEKINKNYDIYRLRRTLEKSLLEHKSYPLEYPTTRFHFIDARIIPSDCLFSLPDKFYSTSDIDKMIEMLKKVNSNCDIFKKFKRNIKIVNDDCIKKQIMYVFKLYDSFFNSDIRTFKKKYKSFLFPLTYQLEYELSFFENIINCLTNQEYDSLFINNVKNYIFKISDLFMESYTLQRMFRSFRQFENNISIEPRNIIFYGGAQHADIFYEILMNCGFKKEYRLESRMLNGVYPYISSLKGRNMFNLLSEADILSEANLIQ